MDNQDDNLQELDDEAESLAVHILPDGGLELAEGLQVDIEVEQHYNPLPADQPRKLAALSPLLTLLPDDKIREQAIATACSRCPLANWKRRKVGEVVYIHAYCMREHRDVFSSVDPLVGTVEDCDGRIEADNEANAPAPSTELDDDHDARPAPKNRP